MYRFIILLVYCQTTLADDEVNQEKCIAALKSHKHCCKPFSGSETSLTDNDTKECKQMPEVPGSCERDICFGTKFGLANTDGTLKMDKLQKHLKEKLADHKNILDAVNEKCYDDKYKLFSEPDECDLKKMKYCLMWQYVFRCPNFDDGEQCTEFKNIAAQCLELDM